MDQYIYNPPPPPPKKKNGGGGPTAGAGHNTSGNSRTKRPGPGSSGNRHNTGGAQNAIPNNQQWDGAPQVQQQGVGLRFAGGFGQAAAGVLGHGALALAPPPPIFPGMMTFASTVPGLPPQQYQQQQLRPYETTPRARKNNNNNNSKRGQKDKPNAGARKKQKTAEHEDEEEDYDDEERAAAAAAASAAGRSVVVPGTSITLNTAAEIEKWVAERRKRWPTQGRIDAKEKLLERVKSDRRGGAAAAPASTPREDGDAAAVPGDSAPSSTSLTAAVAAAPQASAGRANATRVCKYFARKGRCNNGARCPYLHTSPSSAQQTNVPGSGGSTSGADSFSYAAQKRYRRYDAAPRLPLFQMMVRNDLQRENGKLLDLIEYLYMRDKLA